MSDQLPGFDAVPQGLSLPERIVTMHRMYGVAEGLKCATCAHLYEKRWDKSYYKCGLNRDSNGPATDWRKTWPACGKWEEAT